MKKVILSSFLILFLGSGWTLTGGNININKGDAAYKIKNYGDALLFYKKALIKEPENHLLIQKIADSYRLCNQYDSSLHYYNRYVKTVGWDGSSDNVRLNNIDMLLRTGNWKEAEKLVSKFTKSLPDLEKLKNSCNLADSLIKEPTESPEKNMIEFNTTGSEYGVSRYLRNMVFASNRNKENRPNPELGFVNGFTDLYMSKYNDNFQMYDEPKVLKGKINSDFNNATFTYSAQSDWAYITQCTVKPVACYIYKSRLSGDEWIDAEQVNPGPVKMGQQNIYYQHPYLTPDGKTIYYSSNRPGGQGGFDIWKSKVKLPEGTFYDSENLGPIINSKWDEKYPCIIGDSILLFTSTGHKGLGGYDIFRSRIRNGYPGEPVNLGYPVNTNADDFGIIVNENLRGVYFSTNRKNAEEGDDIYFHTTSVLDPLIIKVYEWGTQNPLKGVVITIRKDDNEIKDDIRKETDNKGIAKFTTYQHLECEADSHLVVADHIGYISETRKIPCYTKNEVLIYLKPEPPDSILVKGRVFDILTKLPVIGAKVEFLYLDKVFGTTFSDDQGYFSHKVPRGKTITIRVSKQDYYTDAKTYQTPSSAIVPDEMSKKTGYDTDFGLQPIIPIIRVFFDFDIDTLRLQSRKSLDTLVNLFRLNPDKKITIESHADQMGSIEYNKHLSYRRGNSVYKYLVAHGVNKNLLDTLNFGETKPVVTNPVTPDDYQRNRRTEFKAEYLKPVSSVTSENQSGNQITEINNSSSEKEGKPLVQPGEAKATVERSNLGMDIANTNNPDDTIRVFKNSVDVNVGVNGNLTQAPTRVFNNQENVTQSFTTGYRVQIAALKNPVNTRTHFPNIADLIERYGIYNNSAGGINRYQIGSFTSRAEATAVKSVLESRGYRNCFIVLTNN